MLSPLGAYLESNKIGFTEFARACGLSDSYVWRLAKGRAADRRFPGLRVAALIEAQTKGAVKAADWLATAEPQPKRRRPRKSEKAA